MCKREGENLLSTVPIMLPLEPTPAGTGLNLALLLLDEDQQIILQKVYFEIDDLQIRQDPLFLPVQPVNRLYSFVRVFETFELTLIWQERSEHDSHVNDFLTLSFKLNSGSFSTIAVTYLSCVVNQSGNQSERIQGLVH